MFAPELALALKSLNIQDRRQPGSQVRTASGDVGVLEEFDENSRKWSVRVNDEVREYNEVKLTLLDKKDVLSHLCKEVSPGIWTFPCFNPEFCRYLVEET